MSPGDCVKKIVAESDLGQTAALALYMRCVASVRVSGHRDPSAPLRLALAHIEKLREANAQKE